MAKNNNVDDIVDSIQKKYGNDSLMRMGSNPLSVKRLSSQCLGLDFALGGGFPYGRITEILGNEGSGKTTMALHILSECMKYNGMGAVIDVEHALDPKYAMEIIGKPFKSLLLSQPQSGSQAMDIAADLMSDKIKKENDKPLVIVVDSIAAMASDAELEGKPTDNSIASLARLVSSSLRRLTPLISKSEAIFVCLNQMRTNMNSWQTSEHSAGGKALKFYASVRLQLSASTKRAGDEGFQGQLVKAKTIKNKTYVPFQESELELVFGKGFDIDASLIDAALRFDVVQKKSSWLYYGDISAQGVDKFVENLKSDPNAIEDIRSQVLDIQNQVSKA